MESKWIDHNGIRLFSESFGTPDDPPILLIMGAMASAVWWAEDFCCQLAALKRYVIRYDSRDTGRTTNLDLSMIQADKLKAFRQAAYQYLTRAKDATFELTDAVVGQEKIRPYTNPLMLIMGISLLPVARSLFPVPF